ncbi:hypothetical protein F5Y17DRAFT_329981 [Xylariaceae sp. FL0594]|nr:hypothetical protein F5Y17DRAFT_329981 [Xylariaceae sp. FL0594]
MQLTTLFYIFAFSSYVFSAPVDVSPADSVRRADADATTLRQESRSRRPIKATTRTSLQTNEKTSPKDQRSGLGGSQVVISLDHATPTTKGSPRTPLPSSYLGSLAQRLTNKSPFADSSIVREETRASTEDWEPEATIVEWETKASRESYILIPCLSQGKALHYRRVRVYADMLVVSLVLTLVAVLLIVELWKPAVTRLRRLRSGCGPIYLDTDTKEDSKATVPERQLRATCSTMTEKEEPKTLERQT